MKKVAKYIISWNLHNKCMNQVILSSPFTNEKCKLREVLACGQSCTANEGTEPSNQNRFLWLWKPLSFHYTICLPILHGDNVGECCHACGPHKRYCTFQGDIYSHQASSGQRKDQHSLAGPLLGAKCLTGISDRQVRSGMLTINSYLGLFPVKWRQ